MIIDRDHDNPQLLSCNGKSSKTLFARHCLAVNPHRPFLSIIVTEDEKWCLCEFDIVKRIA